MGVSRNPSSSDTSGLMFCIKKLISPEKHLSTGFLTNQIDFPYFSSRPVIGILQAVAGAMVRRFLENGAPDASRFSAFFPAGWGKIPATGGHDYKKCGEAGVLELNLMIGEFIKPLTCADLIV